jgi:hypothetical protein
VEFAIVQVDAGFSEVLEVGEDAGDPVERVVRAGDMDGVGAEVDGHVQIIFKEAKVFVAGPVQGLNARGDVEGSLIQVVI